MRVIGADDLVPRPGTAMLWAVSGDAAAARVQDAPPSFNQRTHLSGEAPRTWLALAVEVPGPLRRADLARAVTTLLDRHEALRTSFRSTGTGLRRAVHPPGSLAVVPASTRTVTSPEQARDVITAFVDERCAQWSTPPVAVAAVDRPDRSTVVVAVDHALGDAWSLTVMLDEFVRLYRGEPVDPTPPPAFGAHCERESGTVVDPQDARVASWVRFLRAHGDAAPRFPGATGVHDGEVRRAILRDDTLIDAPTADAACRGLGVGPFAAALAALAHGVADTTGSTGPLSLLFPLHTRTLPAEAGAVGWYVTNAPITVELSANIRDTAVTAALALREALPLGAVPIDTVVRAVGDLRRPRRDVFMASYVDYRRLPGHDAHAALDARHVSAVTDADDVQIWFSRTRGGLALRTRYPDTATAGATVDVLVDRVRTHLGALARAARVPAATGPVR
ncbi:condensation domain-containing protein [Rhodococcoides corynebacterioides]|uniref:Condensation domain-containing protein n=1 Tax=Rhodococcoides corynebacterioides TaxID=53972 RepID=A0ABS7P1V6_9NOCA|nr:condensation domain-containing protein [Rhodococcus corynebacterioides]MBY6365872.1 hypothetical protein [Rhodococcus corynebacterioides]MBY6409267.1 hypothetical protein [Rhodococcus corynebacterioides]